MDATSLSQSGGLSSGYRWFESVPQQRTMALAFLLGYELLRPANIVGQVSGYHPIKTLDPDFVLPIILR
jgi:hypothetical protein